MPAPKGKTKTPARKRYHHGNLRPTLIQETLALIAEEGIASLTLRAVARRAGVTHAAPYRHFADKAALLAAVAEEGFKMMRARLLQRNDFADPLTRLQMMGVEYFRFAREHDAHFRVMFGPGVANKRAYPNLHKAAYAAFSVMPETIRECQAKGLAGTGDPVRMGLAAWSMAHGLTTLMLDQQVPPELEEVAENTLFMQLQGILFFGIANK